MGELIDARVYQHKPKTRPSGLPCQVVLASHPRYCGIASYTQTILVRVTEESPRNLLTDCADMVEKKEILLEDGCIQRRGLNMQFPSLAGFGMSGADLLMLAFTVIVGSTLKLLLRMLVWLVVRPVRQSSDTPVSGHVQDEGEPTQPGGLGGCRHHSRLLAGQDMGCL